MSVGKHTLSDMYRRYVLNGGVLPKAQYKNLCSDFNYHVCTLLLEGKKFDPGSELSRFYMVKVKRNWKRPIINWHKSNMYKAELLAQGKKLYDDTTKEGEKWLIYETDPEYIRVHWERAFCKVPNKMLYRFSTARGENGFRTRMMNFHKENPTASDEYPVAPKRKRR